MKIPYVLPTLSSHQLTLSGTTLLTECTTGVLCYWAGSGLFLVDRIIFTLGGYIFGKCGQEGRQVPVMILQLLAFMAQVTATWSTRGEIKHQRDVVRITKSWVTSVLSAPATHHVINTFYLWVMYCTVRGRRIQGGYCKGEWILRWRGPPLINLSGVLITLNFKVAILN